MLEKHPNTGWATENSSEPGKGDKRVDRSCVRACMSEALSIITTTRMFNEHKEDSTPRLPKTRPHEDEHKQGFRASRTVRKRFDSACGGGRRVLRTASGV